MASWLKPEAPSWLLSFLAQSASKWRLWGPDASPASGPPPKKPKVKTASEEPQLRVLHLHFCLPEPKLQALQASPQGTQLWWPHVCHTVFAISRPLGVGGRAGAEEGGKEGSIWVFSGVPQVGWRREEGSTLDSSQGPAHESGAGRSVDKDGTQFPQSMGL